MDSFYQRHLDWLIAMGKHPGFKGHAWHRAKQLDADPSGMWVGIKDALVAAIGREQTLESASLSRQKSH